MAGKTISIIILALAVLALAGCVSEENTNTSAVDTAPPAVPSNLSGEVWQYQVVVRWMPNTTDADLAGYNVYRQSGTRVAALTADPLDQNWYVDVNPVVGGNTYQVTSVDRSGNESAHATVTVDYQYDPYGDYQPEAP